MSFPAAIGPNAWALGEYFGGPTMSDFMSAAAGPSAVPPGMGVSLGTTMGSAHAPLGFSGYMGGGANIMPSMGGFGPMAQLWGAGGALDSLFREDTADVSTAESVLGNAAQGALAGSYFGPPGMIVGGTIGALGGLDLNQELTNTLAFGGVPAMILEGIK